MINPYAIQEVNLDRTFRKTLPSGHYDMVIVSLIHQGTDVLTYISQNIQRYVKGKYLWIVHYNAPAAIDESTLPDFVWLVRNSLKTKAEINLIGGRSNVALAHAICRCIEFALQNITFTNVLLMSSGSSFYRDYTPPSRPYIAINSHELLLHENRIAPHTDPVPTEYIEHIVDYLNSRGSTIPGWQYRYFEKDFQIHPMFRKFKWLQGSQWSGMVFPYDVAKEVAHDMKPMESISNNPSMPDYALEEIVFGTYAYNYAISNGLKLNISETIIDWDRQYAIPIDQIKNYRIIASIFPGIGHMVCKIPYEIGEIHRFLLLR